MSTSDNERIEPLTNDGEAINFVAHHARMALHEEERSLQPDGAVSSEQNSALGITETAGSTLLILGNGFDLQCGLKSGYGHFFDDRFDKSHNFGRFFYNKEEPTDEVITCGISGRLITIWDLIFWDRKKRYFEKWADVEECIFDYLKDFIFRTRNNRPGEPFDLFSEPSEHTSWLNDVKERILFTAYSRFGGIHIYQNEHIDGNNVKHIDGQWVNGSAWLNILFNELKLFEKEFNNYLSSQVLTDRDESGGSYGCSATKFYRQIVKTYAPEDDKDNVRILSFNYTVPLKSASLKPDGLDPLLMNNHGRLNAYASLDIQKHEIIFGFSEDDINDVIKDDNPEVLEKVLHQFTKQQRIGVNGVNWGQEIDYESIKRIVFYGHSLAGADFFHFRHIFDEVSLADGNVELVFLYSHYPGKEKLEIDREQQEAVCSLLSKYEESCEGVFGLQNFLMENDCLKIHTIDPQFATTASPFA